MIINVNSLAADAAAKLLLAQRRHVLPIDPLRLTLEQRICFESIGHYCLRTTCRREELICNPASADGCTLVEIRGSTSYYFILYNESVPNRGRIAFTLAHELGHILLDHLDDDDDSEELADQFAAELLMPRSLVWELLRRNPRTAPEDLCELFGVSYSAAWRKLCGLRTRPDLSADEQRLLVVYGRLLPDEEGPLISW
ncbi:MAG: ImmA/IrrE family metallo-endopeptidase [Oscillospiraceae bacterium]